VKVGTPRRRKYWELTPSQLSIQSDSVTRYVMNILLARSPSAFMMNSSYHSMPFY